MLGFKHMMKNDVLFEVRCWRNRGRPFFSQSQAHVPILSPPVFGAWAVIPG